MVSERSSQQAFFATSALLFAGSAALTIAWCGSMSAVGTMPMPGGWAMSMTWMQMPGQTWAGCDDGCDDAAFVGADVVALSPVC
jgi:hypothetical protein